MTKSDEANQKEASIQEAVAAQEEEQKFDPFEMADEKDCLGKYDAAWCDGLLEKKKWTDKKNGLEELLNDVTTPKIKPGNTSHIVTALAKLLTDSNINVSHISVKCVGSLCEGL